MDSTLNSADQVALAHARATLITMGADPRPAGAPQDTPFVYMANLSDAHGLMLAALAREAFIAAASTEDLIALGNQLAERAPGVPQVAERIPLIRRRLPGLGWPFSYYRAAVAISTTSVTLGILTPSLA